jgi:hypothetical protein
MDYREEYATLPKMVTKLGKYDAKETADSANEGFRKTGEKK